MLDFMMFSPDFRILNSLERNSKKENILKLPRVLKTPEIEFSVAERDGNPIGGKAPERIKRDQIVQLEG